MRGRSGSTPDGTIGRAAVAPTRGSTPHAPVSRRPYYDGGGITIYHADCRDIVADSQVTWDALVTDPPYGIGLRNNDVDGHRSDRDFNITGDDDATWIAEWVSRVASGRPTVVFASPWHPWPGKWRNLIVWDKGGAVGGGGDINTCLKRTWELIQVAGNRAVYGKRHDSVWRDRMSPRDTTSHIAAKPTDLMGRLIFTFLHPDDVVLDPFMGSGSTLVAARNLGRRAIGIEIEERYCEIAARRLDQQVLDLGGV